MSPKPAMTITARTIAEVRERLRDAARPLGLVPTMGALHEGHLELLRHARESNATVVMSLFVNPAQFASGEDLAAYPRDEARDERLAAQAGVDVVFAPTVAEMYPDGFATAIEVTGLSEPLEGAARGAAHFRGVATVVAKLLNIVGPDVAYFGQKDAQQAAVVRRLARDLDMAVAIEVRPTVRAPDGLALSSRNAYLDGEDRVRATGLWRALSAAAALVEAGERERVVVAGAAEAELAREGITAEYLAIVDPQTLVEVQLIEGPVMIAVAARIGGARLIDNVVANPPA
ncbi:MAG TPA: pantoate--beta-alanine ligase [Solirubrobacteraceae bacterium]|jgi:pantoate--beta-alanine ligase|nr:pantoate--beta-alanine ligase [Solirubrobacteraceae bacterium]